jgi:hypothetical protein
MCFPTGSQWCRNLGRKVDDFDSGVWEETNCQSTEIVRKWSQLNFFWRYSLMLAVLLEQRPVTCERVLKETKSFLVWICDACHRSVNLSDRLKGDGWFSPFIYRGYCELSRGVKCLWVCLTWWHVNRCVCRVNRQFDTFSCHQIWLKSFAWTPNTHDWPPVLALGDSCNAWRLLSPHRSWDFIQWLPLIMGKSGCGKVWHHVFEFSS